MIRSYATTVAIALAATAVTFLAACAGADSQPSAEARPQKVYRTGSNLPPKDDDGSVQVVKPEGNSPVLGPPGRPPSRGM
ncbi:MAG: hypothetical protein ABI886_17195 [Betaproteobacteria bacterium]